MGSRAGEVYLDWGGDERRLFRLGHGQLVKVQEATGAGPTGMAARCVVGLALLNALEQQDYVTIAQLQVGRPAEPPEVGAVILQGLLGAGVPAPEAHKLKREWVDERPLIENLPACYQICMAAIMGPEDEPLGERAGEGSPTPSPKDASGSPTTTEPELSPA